ncbi:hypothetical protein FQ154_20530 [Paeniglutamicibacter gangotriensis]|uniref:Uncharacterized protein n=1 Tax=Paeniglutamicibacter gangotriensis TaxID=254787 RepID=A0A5B0DX32_9MICC|nr:hypothetical protein [Paeniglutamicibacter gangotriensis]KAA0971304.1 hypothetical protein FQ154_20530 [Paeniglutamicibacter gangotriensis]
MRDGLQALETTLFESGYSRPEARALAEVCLLEASERSLSIPKSTLSPASANAVAWHLVWQVSHEIDANDWMWLNRIQAVWERFFPGVPRIDGEMCVSDPDEYDLGDFGEPKNELADEESLYIDDELGSDQPMDPVVAKKIEDFTQEWRGMSSAEMRESSRQKEKMDASAATLFPNVYPGKQPSYVNTCLVMEETGMTVPGTLYLAGERCVFFPEKYLTQSETESAPVPLYLADKCSEIAMLFPQEDLWDPLPDATVPLLVGPSSWPPSLMVVYNGTRFFFPFAESWYARMFAEDLAIVFKGAPATWD